MLYVVKISCIEKSATSRFWKLEFLNYVFCVFFWNVTSKYCNRSRFLYFCSKKNVKTYSGTVEQSRTWRRLSPAVLSRTHYRPTSEQTWAFRTWSAACHQWRSQSTCRTPRTWSGTPRSSHHLHWTPGFSAPPCTRGTGADRSTRWKKSSNNLLQHVVRYSVKGVNG